jgi:hypothetical protein
VQLFDGNGEAELREAAHQRLECELAFHARESSTEAEVDPVPEREVVRVRVADHLPDDLGVRRSAIPGPVIRLQLKRHGTRGYSDAVQR